MDEVVSISDYLQPLMELVHGLSAPDEKVILVGHSYGGMGISLAIETFPYKILVAIYIKAFMPNVVAPLATLVSFGVIWMS
ncbi:hypothetical protein Pint_28133 [Pistacia integerrima]|uniref:Uncharacterized protein n=1 Tax=Pistacia integerrima TaxID=434235 RepID=A0ACC0YMQ6_9ROSI|nr:hypothetical protein Pint_28133 [Pistacia integerrima]